MWVIAEKVELFTLPAFEEKHICFSPLDTGKFLSWMTQVKIPS